MEQANLIIEPALESKVKSLLSRQAETLGGTLGFKWLEFHRDKVVARMPVNENTKQPFGLLHGGASVALAESLASVGAWLNIDHNKYSAVGIEINANHLRSLTQGAVIGEAVPLHRGRSTHVWSISIAEEGCGKLVCASRCTLAIIEQASKLKG